MKPSILCINENPSMNLLLETVLSHSYSCISCESVFEGLVHLSNSKSIFVIIVDVDYNAKEVFDFIHHTKTSVVYKKPVIVLSSNQSKSIDEEVIKTNAYDYFLKPFNPIELVRSIDDLSAPNAVMPRNFFNR